MICTVYLAGMGMRVMGCRFMGMAVTMEMHWDLKFYYYRKLVFNLLTVIIYKDGIKIIVIIIGNWPYFSLYSAALVTFPLRLHPPFPHQSYPTSPYQHPNPPQHFFHYVQSDLVSYQKNHSCPDPFLYLQELMIVYFLQCLLLHEILCFFIGNTVSNGDYRILGIIGYKEWEILWGCTLRPRNLYSILAILLEELGFCQ